MFLDDKDGLFCINETMFWWPFDSIGRNPQKFVAQLYNKYGSS